VEKLGKEEVRGGERRLVIREIISLECLELHV
jgi:hypothetical protein